MYTVHNSHTWSPDPILARFSCILSIKTKKNDFCIDIIKEDNLTRFSQFKQIWLKWIVSRDFRSMSFDRSYISTIEGVVL
jgi:hypothetical protein